MTQVEDNANAIRPEPSLSTLCILYVFYLFGFWKSYGMYKIIITAIWLVYFCSSVTKETRLWYLTIC